MTKAEFSAAIAYLASGLSIPPEKHPSKEASAVYHEMLDDVPLPILQAAVKRVVCERTYPTMPTVNELRQACVDVAQGHLTALGPSKAWELVVGHLGRGKSPSYAKGPKGYYATDTEESRFEALPEIARECMRRYGLDALWDTKTSDLQWARKVFVEQIWPEVEKEFRRRALLPASLVRQIEANKPVGALPAAAKKAVAMIGTEKPNVKGRK